jgi:uncharacterized protein (DUF1015 family)
MGFWYAWAVASFVPFAGIRYDTSRVALADVVAPPYDVIGPDEQRRLEERSPYNAVRVELARSSGGTDVYEAARCAFDEWMALGVLIRDPEPAFYIYRMGYRVSGSDGPLRQTTGVIGALALEDAGPEGRASVLPHERTMAKPTDDRLNLLRACRANLSPIWGLSLASGLSDLIEPARPPDERLTEENGVHHRLWRVTEAGAVEAIQATAANAPVVIADGHHRYATALAYRAERRRENGDRPGDHDYVLAFLVELAEDQLTVGAIHRTFTGLPDGFDVAAAVAESGEFQLRPVDDAELVSMAGESGGRSVSRPAPVLIAPGKAWWLDAPGDDGAGGAGGAGGSALGVRRAGGTGPGGAGAGHGSGPGREPDAARLEKAVSSWPPHQVAYVNSVAEVVAAVERGDAQAGFLLRPPTVDQIAEVARAGGRMPQKTTFFRPKPLTGMVFRRLDGE